MRASNVVLIGMPASGKSTVGVVLAKFLGYDFIDTDLLIQRQEGARLEDIIQTRGVEGFLQIESAVCCALDVTHTVVATGGSAVYGEEAMRHLKELGRVVYLRVDIDALASRISDMRQRGVALKDGQSLADLLEERSVLYERYADITVDEGNQSLEGTVSALVKLLS
ncbi:MAG: shikimate kinase [Atopobiaceae bacterium]|nr:shikimate kinase [Atopobiaceae bacterium]